MVLIRPIPELGVSIVCDGNVVRVMDGKNIIEERQVGVSTYLEISEVVGIVENELIEIASAMENELIEIASAMEKEDG